MKLNICLAALSLLVLSCAEHDKIVSNNNTIEINLDEIVARDDSLSTFFSEINYIPLELTENSAIGNVSQIIDFRNHYYILDKWNANALFKFDSHGKFICKIGGIGRGPGEYTTPRYISLDESTRRIYLLDGHKRLIVYDLDGNFINNVVLDMLIQAFEVQDNLIYATPNLLSEKNITNMCMIYNAKGKRLNEYMEYPKIVKDYRVLLTREENFGPMYKTSDGIKFLDALMDTVYNVSRNVYTPYISVSSERLLKKGEINLENKKFDDLADRMTYFRKQVIAKDKFWGFCNYIETENWIHFDYASKHKSYRLFYDKRNSNVHGIYNFVDDLTFSSFRFGTRTVAKGASKNALIEVMSGGSYNTSIAERIIKHKDEFCEPHKIDAIKQIDMNSNPTLKVFVLK